MEQSLTSTQEVYLFIYSCFDIIWTANALYYITLLLPL